MRKAYWRHNWKTGVLVTLGVLLVSELTVMALYPVEVWPWEMSFMAVIVTVLTMPIVVYFAGQSHENRMLVQTLERLVNRDRLTDLATRDRFYELMDADPDPFGAVLMVDIDDFKQVNDTYGHLTGDAVLRHVADLLREACQPTDILCRFGGEEVLIFLGGARPDTALELAERLRRVVSQSQVEAASGPLRMTISVGVAMKTRHAPIDSAIADADTALYVAKNEGRNRVAAYWALPRQTVRAAS